MFENVLFDIIIFGDVLEHLSNPKNTILKCKKYLKNHGYILCCIPNVQHISVVYPLLHGRFTYKKMGLLDETHIHLFTGIEIYNMFQECGFEIENIDSTTVTIDSESEDAIRKIKEIFPDVNETLFLAYQYLVCAKNLV